MARGSRAVWAKRVQRWERSGLSAEEFAAKIGVRPRTLGWWRWKLGQLRSKKKARAPKRRPLEPLAFIEIDRDKSTTEPFVLELRDGRRVTVPIGFDRDALERLLSVLEPST